jgi:DNA-binding GntR family transcriptional regulator
MESPVRTANELVYEALRSRILASDLVPGEWLREQDLVEHFNVSRTPVREALRRLESEQLVQIVPYRGARVIKPDAQTIREEYIVRAALEGLAVELAVAQIDDAALAALEAMAAAMARLLDQHQIEDFLKINQQFHMTIYAFSGTQRLLSMIQEAWDRDNIYRRMFLTRWPAALQIEKRIHRNLLDALQARNGDEARRLMQQSCFDMCALIVEASDHAE